MAKSLVVMAVILFASTAWAQGSPKKYPWQEKDTNCTHGMTFCWYGSDLVADPEVTAFGPRWVSQDKEEKPLEWVSAVRCVKALHICILARNQKLLFGGGTMTNIDLYHVQEWSEYQIRAVGENDLPHGEECEIDSLLLNREDASISMLSVPGPGATNKGCEALMKPKTVMYRLQLGLPEIQKETP
jgi:hypothetical protein